MEKKQLRFRNLKEKLEKIWNFFLNIYFYFLYFLGFYSPIQGKATPERLNAFRNVGRLMGLCLLQNELCPLFLNRHVIKFMLGRKVRFHDLAFFDPVIYESLRQLVVDAENKVTFKSFFKNLMTANEKKNLEYLKVN